ncbi:MAG: hypothetical protein V4525_08410 [Pseudomonadota bacterium]
MTLPDPEDPQGVFAYAMTFNAYETLGSREAAAALARRAPRSMLHEVRAELFFKARASRHREDDTYFQEYRELLPLLRRFSESGAT